MELLNDPVTEKSTDHNLFLNITAPFPISKWSTVIKYQHRDQMSQQKCLATYRWYIKSLQPKTRQT